MVAFDGAQTSFAMLAQRGHATCGCSSTCSTCSGSTATTCARCRCASASALLRDALAFDDPIRFTQHRNRDGEAFFEEACRKGWEGLIAKRADSRLRDLALEGLAQAQVRAGPGAGDRRLHGAQGLAHRARRAAARRTTTAASCATPGKVGTGFDQATLDSTWPSGCAPLRRDEPPFADAEAIKERGVTWVEPELVAQVGFTEWTGAGRLRHPRFLGLRTDKAARDVVREAPTASSGATPG